jgi:hypothetical protein
MSLNYNLTQVSDKADREKSEAIIFMCMAVGMPGITKKNYEEFYSRVTLSNLIYDIPTVFTIEDVASHIGLTTNVTKRNRVSFLAGLYRGWTDKHYREWRGTNGKINATKRLLEEV